MINNQDLEPNALPEAEEKENAELKGTIPEADEKEILIPVKFNKETKNLKPEEAGCLAQKGMKYDLISKEYESLKQIAKNEGQSVNEFLLTLSQRQINSRKNQLLEQCGGNEELADHILGLEQKKNENDEMGFSELKEEFPEIKSIEELPESVIESAKLKGTLLLDEYLRYKLSSKKMADSAVLQQENANLSSIGSQADRKGGLNPEASEFLKGLWK